MKYLNLFILALSFCLTACNNNDEPPIEVNLQINEQFIPHNVTFNMSDTEYKDLTKPWWNKQVVVNSKEEIPDDPFGFPESYYRINFAQNTLLLFYDLSQYNIVSCANRYYRNNAENTYNWCIILGISGFLNEDEHKLEKVALTRYAILVPKLPTDTKVIMWQSITDHNWDWNKN